MTNNLKPPSSSQASTPAGEPFNLASLAGYVGGSIVSKTLVNRPVGTVTFFSFDAAQGLSEHSAPYDALVQILDGEAEITIGSKVSLVRTGHAIIMPADIPHAVAAPVPMKMLLTMIRG